MTVLDTTIPEDRADVTYGRCENCEQPRPLWRYRPSHTIHVYGPARAECRWCQRADAGQAQPLLCVRCWSAEAVCEARTAISTRERSITEVIVAANVRQHPLKHGPASADDEGA